MHTARRVPPSDEALLREVAARSRVRDAMPLSAGRVFLIARAHHIATRRQVLLTIARPNDLDARGQIAAVRSMLDKVHDERIGVVIDVTWRDQATDSWWCLISPLHTNLQPLDEALLARSKGSSRVEVLRTLRDVCLQLHAIHAAGFAHGDISMQNIGLDEHGVVHLTDFEHIVGEENLRRRRVAATPGYGHPDKLTAAVGSQPAVSDHQRWDKYALGQVLLNLLTHLTPHSTPELTARNQRAIRLLGALMLDGRNNDVELALGLDREFFQSEQLASMHEVVEALDRLLKRQRAEDRVPELSASLTRVMEVGGSRPVPFTRRVDRITDNAYMRKLDDFNQLGLISYIWPTATHRRKEHALGTFGVCVSFVRGLVDDPENPLFEIIMSPERVRVVLLAALLHDVGHYPIAHDLEEAHDVAFAHERRSAALIQSGDLASVISAPEADEGWDVDPIDVASVIDGTPLPGSTMGRHLVSMLHSIISGPIDADKLDYLRRDGAHLNVRAGGGLDSERLIAALTVATVPSADGSVSLRVAVRNKARRPAELVGRIRSHMFGVAYWHHSYRAIKAMIQWIVWLALERSMREGANSPSDVAEDFFSWLDMQISPPQVPLGHSGGELSQLGSWERGALPSSEAEVLRWFVERGNESSERLVEVLSDQRWYRSVLEIEHYGTVERESTLWHMHRRIWHVMHEIYVLDADVRWRARVELNRRIQDLLVEWLTPLTEGAGGTIVYDFDEWQTAFIARSVQEQLVLIDGPDEGRAFQKPLYYTIGEHRRHASIDASKSIRVARSYDDEQLASQFVVSNGVVRLFVHPSFADFLETSATSEALTRLVIAAFDEIDRAFGLSRGPFQDGLY